MAENIVKRPEPIYQQQLHADCGGWIVVVAKPGMVAAACNRCQLVWEIEPSIHMGHGCTIPSDWKGFQQAAEGRP